MITGLILSSLLAAGGINGTPIHVVVDPAHKVVCYWIPFAARFNAQPALSCVYVPSAAEANRK